MTGSPALISLAILLFAMLGCVETPSRASTAPTPDLAFEPSARPATDVGAQTPRMLVRASGMIALAQVETEGRFADDLVVYRSTSGGDLFTEPIQVNRGGGPVLAHGEGAPAFLQGPGSQFHAVWISNGTQGGRSLLTARSKDFLQSFDEPVVIATGARGEPAFFDATVLPDGRVAASWLARAPKGESLPGTSHLLVGVAEGPGAGFGPPVIVASDVCPCCRPALLAGDDRRLHIAWRTTDAENVRSMVLASSDDAGRSWSEPVGVPGMGWKIDGCPHSGPALAHHEGRLHVAWYSEGEGSPRLYWSREEEDGSFAEARDLSRGARDANHPCLGIADGKLFAAFQARDPEAAGGWPATGIYITQIVGDRALTPVAVPKGSGTASYPRIRALGAQRLMVAWTEHNQNSRQVMLARARLGADAP